MLYVIDQRLKAQGISLEKSAQGILWSIFFENLFFYFFEIWREIWEKSSFFQILNQSVMLSIIQIINDSFSLNILVNSFTWFDMCFIRSEANCPIDESPSMSAHFDCAAMSNSTNWYCVLFANALGYDIDGQTVGFDGNAIQVAIVYDSRESIAFAWINLSSYGRCGQINARNEENLVGGLDKTMSHWILGQLHTGRNWYIDG